MDQQRINFIKLCKANGYLSVLDSLLEEAYEKGSNIVHDSSVPKEYKDSEFKKQIGDIK